MKVNFDATLKNLHGKNLEVAGEAEGTTKAMTLAHVAAEALLYSDPQARESGESKAKAYALAMRTYKGGEVEITVEEAALLKSKVGEVFAPIVVGQAFELLEQRVVPEA